MPAPGATRGRRRAFVAAVAILGLGLSGCASTTSGQGTIVGGGDTSSSSPDSSPAQPHTSPKDFPSETASSGPISAPPRSNDPFSALNCATLIQATRLGRESNDSGLRTGAIPANTKDRESIGSLIKETEQTAGRPAALGTYIEKDTGRDGRVTANKSAYACFDNATDFGVSLSMQELSAFYNEKAPTGAQAPLRDNIAIFSRNAQSHAPTGIVLFLAHGLSLSEIKKNGPAEQAGTMSMVHGTLLIVWYS